MTLSSHRARVQSTVLVSLLTPVLAVIALRRLFMLGFSHFAVAELGIALTFAALVWVLRAATLAAAACGALVCLLVGLRTAAPNASLTGISAARSGLLPLAALFVLTFVATRVGRPAAAVEEMRPRAASQVLANLGVAGLVSAACLWLPTGRGNTAHWFSVASASGPLLLLAALAEATADTVSSELGRRFGGMPILITTLGRVPAGTDGAVSLAGTLAGMLAAAGVASVGAYGLRLEPRLVAISYAAALTGFFADSLLGATLERRGYLANDLVNFCSTAVAALAAGLFLLAFRR